MPHGFPLNVPFHSPAIKVKELLINILRLQKEVKSIYKIGGAKENRTPI